MAKRAIIPVTPSVLTWAMKEAGYATAEVAKRLKVPETLVEAWQEGAAAPTLTQFRKLAEMLRRTPSTLLLPEPPEHAGVATVSLRRAPTATRTDLSPAERRHIREAKRAQEAIGWILEELGEPGAELPSVKVDSDPEKVGVAGRVKLTGTENGSFTAGWKTPPQAFSGWRGLLESSGVLVFTLAMGKESCSGFSLSHPRAPLIAVNTAQHPSARLFTLFHEYGHLLTRTDSACLITGKKVARPTDTTERWCERFSASFLMPRAKVEGFLRQRYGWQPNKRIESLNVAGRLAAHFRVSVRAATIRLIELGAAQWSLYESIPPYEDLKKPGGGGGEGRDRGQIREDEYGRAVNIFVRALDQDLLGRAEILDYLDVADTHLERMQRRAVG